VVVGGWAVGVAGAVGGPEDLEGSGREVEALIVVGEEALLLGLVPGFVVMADHDPGHDIAAVVGVERTRRDLVEL
jgi:hypothetical protein